ncbi:MAG: hypothetical protein J7L07_08265 [Candidatus Odinarchaeota archaeon]|nr:hypothetical protein [Candidatus Odinarchaeota archaeon]
MAYGEYSVMETLAIALWAGVVSYYWELFGYYLLIKWYRDRKTYEISFALFFLFMAVGRVFFVIYDFYISDIFWWRLGTFFQWLGLTIVAVTLTLFLFEKNIFKYTFITPPIIISFAILATPSDSINVLRMYLGFIFAPIYALLIPGLFFYLAYRLRGRLQIATFLQGLGFLVLYMGRVLHASVVKEILSPAIYLLVAPAIVILALLFIVMGIQMIPE